MTTSQDITKAAYNDGIRKIFTQASDLHRTINAVMDLIEEATSAEWRELHQMMKAADIVSSLAYDRLYPQPSVFAQPAPEPFNLPAAMNHERARKMDVDRDYVAEAAQLSRIESSACDG